MRDNGSGLTGAYYAKLNRQLEKAGKRTGWIRFRRIVLFILMIVVCAVGLLLGVAKKNGELETQYQRFLESYDRTFLDDRILEYKDTYSLFVKEYLGNLPQLSLTGGYFCSGESCCVYPDPDAEKTILRKNEKEYLLSSYLADNINLNGEILSFRNPQTRKIYRFNVETHDISALNVSNVGQCIVCGEDYFYIDLSGSSLKKYSLVSKEETVLIPESVSSFVIAGNDLFFINQDHALYRYNLQDSQVSLALDESITSFCFNGELWICNGSKVFRKQLNENKLTLVELDRQCSRLLQSTETGFVFESDDGVYLYNLDENKDILLGNDIFISMSGSKILWFDNEKNVYRVEEQLS